MERIYNFFLFSIFIFSNSLGGELDFSISAGPKHSFGIEYLYLTDRIDFFLADKKAEEKKSSFITSDFAAGYKFKDISAEYSLATDTSLSSQKLSRMNQFAEVTNITEINDYLSFDLTLQAHHSAENYESFTNLYTDSHLFFNLFYDMSDLISLSAGIKEGYYYPFYENLKYLHGSVSGIEASIYLYPQKDMNFIRVSAGLDYFSFRDEKIKYDFNELYGTRPVNRFTLQTQNKYMKFYSAAELSWKTSAISILSKVGYSLVYWMDSDYYTFTTLHSNRPMSWREQRIEHIPEISTSLIFDLSEQIGLKFYGDLRHNFSTLGDGSSDYTNYSITSYSLGFSTILKI